MCRKKQKIHLPRNLTSLISHNMVFKDVGPNFLEILYMWNPVSVIPFFRDDRNYPQFVNRKARTIVLASLMAALLLPWIALAIMLEIAVARNNVAGPNTLVNGLLIAGAIQLVFASLFVSKLFSEEKEKVIIDPDELLDVINTALDDPTRTSDPSMAIIEHIQRLERTRLRDLEKQINNWKDLEVKHLGWRDMKLGKKILYSFSLLLPASLAAYSLCLMFGFVPTHQHNSALDATPNGRMMNEFFSGKYDFIIGLFVLVFSGAMFMMFYHMGRVDYRSRSEDSLKGFMKEMGIK